MFAYYQKEWPNKNHSVIYDALSKDLEEIIVSKFFNTDTTRVLKNIRDTWDVRGLWVTSLRHMGTAGHSYDPDRWRLWGCGSLKFGSLGTIWKKIFIKQSREKVDNEHVDHRKAQFQLSATKYQKGVATVVHSEIDKWTEEAINDEVSISKRSHENEEAVASKKQRQTRHGRNIPNYRDSDEPEYEPEYEPKKIRRKSNTRYSQMTESQQSTPYLTPPMTEIAESSSSNSDLGDLEGSETKNARSQYVRYDSSSHESTPCPTRSVIMTPNMTPNKPIVNQAHENVNNNHDNEEHAFTLDRDDIPEEELEDDLLQETPGAIVDCKLIINDVCIRSAMEKWRKSSKYVEEIHKQDLMRYNIIDTTALSATEARELFEEHWDDIISTIEKLLTLSPNATQLASASASTSASSDQDTVQDGQVEEVKQYIKYISKNVNTAKRLRETIKTERAKLRTDGNIKWKRRALGLMKIFRDQFPNGVNYFKEDQTEYDYIIRFISHVYTILFKEDIFETSLSLKDDDRRFSGNKIDAIISMLDLDLEISVLEVSGSPTCLDHTHYVGDRNKIAKMLKIILNYIKINYSGCYEDFRRIKVFGIQVYDHNFYIYSMCFPFAGVYYFKLEKKFSCPTMTFLLFKELPKFASNLWMMRDIIISSTERIYTYVTNIISESSDDDSKIDKVKTSPPEKRRIIG
ncbi:4289_t:CDS:10 [Funneliformis mosseae]|uniref:4289_t:CDS:1 n=1 Tax=Funneliformis mosseae TaxID=27381 RepID=A0A9N9E0S0_FUNMO|nr:4289_t:CDS:10 [Funneliformis mosseae]